MQNPSRFFDYAQGRPKFFWQQFWFKQWNVYWNSSLKVQSNRIKWSKLRQKFPAFCNSCLVVFGFCTGFCFQENEQKCAFGSKQQVESSLMLIMLGVWEQTGRSRGIIINTNVCLTFCESRSQKICVQSWTHKIPEENPKTWGLPAVHLRKMWVTVSIKWALSLNPHWSAAAFFFLTF